MAIIDEIKPKVIDKETIDYCNFIDLMLEHTTTDSRVLAYGAYYNGINCYKALIATNMQPRIAALHAISHGIYKQINREEQVEMFNIVWKRSAEYQLKD